MVNSIIYTAHMNFVETTLKMSETKKDKYNIISYVE